MLSKIGDFVYSAAWCLGIAAALGVIAFWLSSETHQTVGVLIGFIGLSLFLVMSPFFFDYPGKPWSAVWWWVYVASAAGLFALVSWLDSLTGTASDIYHYGSLVLLALIALSIAFKVFRWYRSFPKQ